MEILELVDKLEAMAAQARKTPITGRAKIDAEKLLELTEQMRASIPRNMQDAQDVLQRREQIVNQTMLDARRIRATAEGDARALVDEHGLVKAANERVAAIIEEAGQKAARIISLAEQEARRRREGADRYCQETLERLEGQVVSLLGTIRAGQRVLTPGLDTPRESVEKPVLSAN